MTDEDPYPHAAMGRRLVHARGLRKMSQGELADAIEISRQALVLWEIGKSEPGAAKLHRAAEVLGTSIEWLLTGEGDGPKTTDRSALRAMIRNLERKLEALDN